MSDESSSRRPPRPAAALKAWRGTLTFMTIQAAAVTFTGISKLTLSQADGHTVTVAVHELTAYRTVADDDQHPAEPVLIRIEGFTGPAGRLPMVPISVRGRTPADLEATNAGLAAQLRAAAPALPWDGSR